MPYDKRERRSEWTADEGSVRAVGSGGDMHHFDYVRPQSVGEALTLLNLPGSRVLAGGTDLMVLARSTKPDFARVVDISQLPELRGISLGDGQLYIGAAACFSQVANNPLVLQHVPCLAQACRSIGTHQIANMATIGGNVVNAAAAADSVTALVCLDAVALLATAAGEQRVAVADLILGHNRSALPPGALLTAIIIPLPAADSRTVFLKIGRRNALTIARMNLAALGRLAADGTIAEARLAAGACFRRPHRVSEVEQLLLDQPPAPQLFSQAGRRMADLMLAESGQRWSTEYKLVALAGLVEEALEQVLQRQ